MGKDCACLSVVLVLECIAVRVGVRILPYGQGLSLSLRGFGARVFSAYGYGDVGKACACLPVFLVLVCSVRMDTATWARLALVSQ